jgi:hypothetical protein
MRYAWLPAPYLALWVTFLLGVVLRFLQARDPEEYDRYHGLGITDLGHRLTMTCGPLLFFATLWIAHVSWERVIRQKRKRPHVELTQVEQFYGGAVFVRKIPRRVWNAAGEGDRLIKPRWGLLVRHQPRR